ncbi:MAG: Uma2 family endonuclease [Hyphomicrobiaceae bacterium]|nr:Uma2 family endonuclease [Hyphomicrobiaceae bacterium]
MNAFAKVDKETFLRFAAEHAEQRYEYVRGRIVQQMTGGTKDHGQVARRITRSLEDQLDAAAWLVLPDRGVETSETIRYPDVCIEPADEPGESLSTGRAVLIVEVLSPSTSWSDLDVKPAEYMSLASLDAYVIASQSEPAMLVYERDKGGRFPAAPREVEGMGATLNCSGRSFMVSLRLADIYKGIV